MAILVGSLFLPKGARPLAQQPAKPITEEEAHAIGVNAYIYFYPLITMELTRKQLTNIEPGKEIGKGPVNTFSNAPQYPPVDFKSVVRPNFDTLYSSAWLDLTREPVIVSAPDTGGRYYLLPMLDMWTDVFASPGWRTTGTLPVNFLIAPLSWQGKVPAGVERINSPTPYVWIIGRTKTDGPQEYDAVHKIQAGYKVTSLSRWGKPPVPMTLKIDPEVDMKTPPKLQVDVMRAAQYFAYAAELIKVNPPHLTDEPILALMKRIGIEPGKKFEFKKLDPQVQRALADVPEAAQKLMAWKMESIARVANGWSMNTDTVGVYGNYYLKRALIARVGLGANLPEDAVYPMNLADSAGDPLDGAFRYRIHFEKGATPPVNAFWSVALYDTEGFQVANPINRFALGSWMPLKFNADGSLDLFIQNQSPDVDRTPNWLPAPKGPFNLLMRLYAPKTEVLTGQWNPPPVTKLN